MKKIIALLMALVMLVALAGCTKGNDAQLAALQEQISSMQAQLQQQNDTPAAEAPLDDVPPSEYIFLYNAVADGADKVEFKGHTTITAQPVIPEGMALEAWVINGVVPQDHVPEETLTINADTTTVIQALLRPEKTVATINAQMKFLNEKGEPKGEPFEEFVFEEEFLNPVTEQMHQGGTITVYVEAVVPKGYVIDYWKINEIPYYFNKTVSAFIVEELDESTVYEVVLREAKATPTPKPTQKPAATPVATQEIEDPITDWEDNPMPEEAPKATPAPVYYNVSCSDCKFDGKTSGQVPAGTTITVTGNDGYGSFEVNGAVYARDKSSITLTINADTFIDYLQVIN